MSRPLASLSLDLDNQWTYMRVHGDAGWESYPSYLDVAVPRILEVLEQRGLRITFLVVGQDAALDRNREALAAIAEAGHEIGNHSFRHESWLHLYSEAEIEAEVVRAEEAIEEATGVRTTGFRGPGYSLSPDTLRVLARRGYRYDASTLPTYLGPLARAYYFHTAKLSAEEREERKILFGTFRDGLRPVRPYRWRLADSTLLELPVTTLPFFKVPFHVSYLLYLGLYSHLAAKLYFRQALALCRLTGTSPSLLLHPLDFLGGDDCGALSFFPAMRLSGAVKARRTAEFLDLYRARFDVVTLGEHAAALEEVGGLSLRDVRECGQ